MTAISNASSQFLTLCCKILSIILFLLSHASSSLVNTLSLFFHRISTVVIFRPLSNFPICSHQLSFLLPLFKICLSCTFLARCLSYTLLFFRIDFVVSLSSVEACRNFATTPAKPPDNCERINQFQGRQTTPDLSEQVVEENIMCEYRDAI